MPEVELTDADSLIEFISMIREEFKVSGKVSVSWKSEKSMTATQRGSLHVYLEQLATVLNDAGFDEAVYFREHAKKGIRVPFTKESVKRIFYKPVLDSQTGKKSTEDMSTLEPSEICMIVGAALADRLGIVPPAWPTRFNIGE